MKLITVLLCVLSLAASAQVDSLASRIQALEVENERIKGELWRSHEKFRLGAIVTGVGLGLVGFEALTYEDAGDLETEGNNRTPVFALIGGGLMLVGSIIMVDSHRHIGLAGRTKKNPSTWRPFNFRKKKQGK